MQGSGTFCVEATVGSVLPRDGRLLVLANGAYGQRIAQIADRLGIAHALLDAGETVRVEPALVAAALEREKGLSHVAVVHCETTTGILNPVTEIGRVVKTAGLGFIVDAMSSFGGIEMDWPASGADFIVTSANKCLEGVPGCGMVLARPEALRAAAGRARSLSLDLYDQWRVMEEEGGKWRFTSPTHVVRALAQAVAELAAEGGVPARAARYRDNQRRLVEGMAGLGFAPLLPRSWQSPIITSFRYPDHPDFAFPRFYAALKAEGFVIYPGKVTGAATFRIGNIGQVFAEDIARLLAAVAKSRYWL